MGDGAQPTSSSSSRRVVPQHGKPDRKVPAIKLPATKVPATKVHAITAAGRKELSQWAAEASLPTPIRKDLLVKVLGGPYADPGQLLADVQRRRRVHAGQLAS